jgi:hypothetical protein
MKLSKLDLSNILAVGHADGYLQLVLDRGEELEIVEIPAPIQAYEGLQQLNELAAQTPALPCEPEPIAMLPVSSSMANAVGYDPEEELLLLEFCNGAVYQYSGVDSDTWEELCSADSVGTFFNENIRGRYEYECLDITEYTDNNCH